MPKHKHKNISEEDKCQRPYRVECTGSLPNSEVKRRRARLVLGWGTAREDLRVLLAFSLSVFFHIICFDNWTYHNVYRVVRKHVVGEGAIL